MVLLHSGNEVTEAQVNGTNWSGAKEALKAKISVTMKPAKAKTEPVLPLHPAIPIRCRSRRSCSRAGNSVSTSTAHPATAAQATATA